MTERPYTAQEWQVGEILTAEKLNILERALYDIDGDVFSFKRFYEDISPLLNTVNDDKVIIVKDAHLQVTDLVNLLPDGDIVQY